LRWLPSGIKPLAWLPVGSHPELPIDLGPIHLFAVGGSLGRGKVLVLADHSIFINQMMLPIDNGNLQFAYNALKWLRGDSEPRRTKVLFVEDGTIHSDLNVPLKEGQELPPGADRVIVAAIDDALARMEERNAFNNAFNEWLDSHTVGGRSQLLRRFLEVLTLALLVYAVYRLGVRARYRLDIAVPLLAHEVNRHRPAASLVEQRYRAVQKGGNLYETAHGVARQWLASLPLTATGPTVPHLAVQGGWWRRLAVRRRFGRLWRLAHGTSPTRVTPRGLRRLLRELDEMKAALANGTIEIQGRNPTGSPHEHRR
jgi:hypothetical protein